MRRIAPIAAACAAIGASAVPAALAGEIDLGLEEVLANTPRGEIVSALVYMADQGEVDQLAAELDGNRVPFSRRNEEIVRTLRDTAQLTQGDLLNELAVRRNQGAVEKFESYWIANIVRVDATEQVLREIAARPDVMRVYYNLPIEGIGTVEDDQVQADRRRRGQDNAGGGNITTGAVEAGVEAVRAPDVWGMGYTGEGILIATMDSGVDGNHPALASRWRGLDPAYAGNPEWAWFDPITSTTFPQDFGFSSHGTHTMGTVLGGAPGDQIGVAPGAQWIHAGVIDRGGIDATIANAILSFQWMAAPTGNPGDSWAVPRVCSNSWGTVASHGHPNCDETFWMFIDNSEAAGTIQFFSAGNEGSGPTTLRRPADRATSDYQNVAVAAIDPANPNWPAASFSSRGPTFCNPDGTAFIKPNISAPGVGTRSSVAGGGYGTKGGTSMASPHINGVAALMLEACDVLTSEEVKQIMYDTAVDLGEPGKDNTYGWGMVDAYEAVNLAIAQCTIGLKIPDGAPTMLDPGVETSFTVEVVEGTESVVPGSEKLFYRFDDGSFQSVNLTPTEGGLYTATLPAASCDQIAEFYVQVEGDGGTIRTNPSNAPASVLSALVGEFVTIEIYTEDFNNGMPAGWSSNGLWNVTSNCPAVGDCSGTQWAYYGLPDACDFDAGASEGEMLSASIQLPQVPAGGDITVSFCYSLNCETSTTYDRASFGVAGEAGTLLSNPDPDEWVTYTTDMSDYAGQTVNLRWHFDTVDGVANGGRGWQVNNIRITTTQLQCEDPEPKCATDFNGDGVIDVSDLLQLLSAWGNCGGCVEDLNSDGTVDVSDLLSVLSAWGDC